MDPYGTQGCIEENATFQSIVSRHERGNNVPGDDLLPGFRSCGRRNIPPESAQTANPAQTTRFLGPKKGFRKGAVDAGGEVSGEQVNGQVIGRPGGFGWNNLNGGEWP